MTDRSASRPAGPAHEPASTSARIAPDAAHAGDGLFRGLSHVECGVCAVRKGSAAVQCQITCRRDSESGSVIVDVSAVASPYLCARGLKS